MREKKLIVCRLTSIGNSHICINNIFLIFISYMKSTFIAEGCAMLFLCAVKILAFSHIFIKQRKNIQRIDRGSRYYIHFEIFLEK